MVRSTEKVFLDKLCRTWLSAGNQLLRWRLLPNAMHNEIKQFFEQLTIVTVFGSSRGICDFTSESCIKNV